MLRFQSLLRNKNLSLPGIMIKALVASAAAVVVFSSFTFAAPPEWTATPPIHARPDVTTSPAGLNPADIRAAYGIPSGNVGAGTIAIVDAYGSSTIQNDLKVFSQPFGLPYVYGTDTSLNTLKVMMQPGAKSTNAGWAMETALDVEWAHAIAPAAKVVLVVAKSASLSDLLWAVDIASSQAGVVAVSMSWGGSESANEASNDYHFSHPGITYLASSGDNGAGVEWPAVSFNVVGVGGTTLKLSNGTWVETAWSGSGGGISAYETKPQYQTSTSFTNLTSYTSRAVPDVAFNADPASGVSIYDSTKLNGQSGWFVVGGTSAGAPAWAGLIALTTTSGNVSSLYSLANTGYSTYYNDITSGSNGNSAVNGYDMVTGLGSPKASALMPALVGK